MEKHYILYTSFDDKDKLKDLGCKWCIKERMWYCFNSNLDNVKMNFNNYKFFENKLLEKNIFQINYINEIISKCNELNIPQNADNIFEKQYYTIYYCVLNQLLDYMTFNEFTKIKDKNYRIKSGGKDVVQKNYNDKFTLNEKKIWKKFYEYYNLPSFHEVIDTCIKIIDEQHISINGWKVANHNSKYQELFWKEKLQNLYPNISYQFKKDNCIFDFIDFDNKIIFEAKLSYNHVVVSQFSKYRKIYRDFQIVYLIATDKVSYLNCFTQEYFDKLLNEYNYAYQIYKNNNYKGNAPEYPKEYNIYYEYNLINDNDLYENINYYNKTYEDIIELLNMQKKQAKTIMITQCDYV